MGCPRVDVLNVNNLDSLGLPLLIVKPKYRKVMVLFEFLALKGKKGQNHLYTNGENNSVYVTVFPHHKTYIHLF
ncbi:MAG: hypothetical protein AYK19_16300 [Theionarchaea archaeon DG-70-1]|nr:MAG: hypothetical protein AYK19_16300 [Theionarchaea archaeon DG-70-1]